MAVSTGAHAQEDEPPSRRQVSTGVDSIVVTAQKREENAQDIAVQVSGLDAAAIEKTFARDIQDVESISPNLIIDPILGNGTAAISIRGMQLNDVEKSFDPAVAVYLDGVYLATTTGALLQIWDAEGVEVLRGPQGTLFGRNTIGGLVHVKRKRPSGELGARASATVGSFGRADFNGRVNLPSIANDTLSFKLAVNSQNGGGYFENIVRGEDEGDTDYLGFNVAALYEPNENFDMLVSYDYIDDETPTRPVTSLSGPGELFCIPGVFDGCGQPQSQAGFHRDTTTTLDQEAFVETHAITIQPSYQVTDNHRIEGVFGWRDTEEDAIQEFDGVEANLFQTQRPQNLEQLSGEVRLHSDWMDGRVQSVVGAYYFESEYDLSQTTTSLAFFGVPAATGDVVTARPVFKQEQDTWSIFGQVDIDVTDRLGLSLGGRYLEEDKTACGQQRLELLDLGVVPVATYGADGFFVCDASDATFQPTTIDPNTGEVVPQTGQDSWDAFTPRVSVSYNTDNALLFFTYSEGFRSGGFNGRSTEALNLGPYEPEELTTYEFGFKSNWLDSRLQLNVAAFFNNYDNKQEDVVFGDGTGVTVTTVQNAATASIDGVEAEWVAVPFDGLTLSGSIGLLDAEYDDYPAQDANGNALDKSDFELRRAPDLTYAINGLYEREVGNGNFVVATANWSYRDDYWIIANSGNRAPDAPGFQEGYGILDLSLNYETDKWRLSLFGKNVANADYFLHVLDVGADYVAASATDPTPVYVPGLWTFGTVSPPPTWGVELDVTF
ncbi:MAG: TonB-dependent receptor [Caulobacterales bacterium]|nr:TonB-dependent receptor [Caulobacterales bacterium]